MQIDVPCLMPHGSAHRHSQPGIVKVFEQIWGTDDLIASFDGLNASLPINKETGRTDIEPTPAWPRELDLTLPYPAQIRNLC